MKIALVQQKIDFYKNKDDWFAKLEKTYQVANKNSSELILFPEYGSLDLLSLNCNEKISSTATMNFHSHSEYLFELKKQLSDLQNHFDFFIQSHKDLSKKYSILSIAPSFPLKVENKFINRAFVVNGAKELHYQDKSMMTRFENEEWGISSGGKNLKIFKFQNIKFGIQICYDSEFPIMSRALSHHGADLLLIPSCTEGPKGASRVHISSRARAIENQCYCGISQTLGDSLWNLAVDKNYGFGAFYSPVDKGFTDDGVISISEPQNETVLCQNLDFKLLQDVRKNGQVFNFADHEKLFNQSDFFVQEIQL